MFDRLMEGTWKYCGANLFAINPELNYNEQGNLDHFLDQALEKRECHSRPHIFQSWVLELAIV